MSNQDTAIEILSHFTAQLSALHRIYLELSRIDVFDDLCRQAVVLWRDKLKMGRLGIWMVCPDRPNYLCGAFGVDETGGIRDERGQSFENDAPIFLQILQDQQQVYYNANHQLLDHQSKPVGIGETAAAALWDGARVLGFVVTDNLLSRKTITETERQVLYLFGQMLGHLVSQKHAESAIRENERRYRLINEMTQAIIREGNFQDTLQILVSRFAELLEARHCHLILWDTASQRATGWANAAQTGYSPTADDIAFTGKALKSGVAQMYHSDNPGEGLSGECLALPLIAKQQSLGAILLDTVPGCVWSKNQIETGTNASAQVALALLQAQLLEQTQQLATYDFLTGVYNRRTFMELADKLHQRAKRYNEPLTVIMVDIDQFKNINDTYGHRVGDQVLQVIAKACQQNLRSVDLLGRYGGEEFIILLPLTSASAGDLPSAQSPAVQLAERLRSTIAEIIVPNHLGDIRLTISLGIAGREHGYDDLEQLINCADIALYESKKNGRNRVTVFSSTSHPNTAL